MKFSYEYKTSSNERRQGEIRAASKEDVFRRLKPDGIRPFNVKPTPGLANRILGLGFRWIVISVLSLLVVALLFVLFSNKRETRVLEDRFEDSTRRQIIGDRAFVEKGIRTEWADVFPSNADRFLASFAVPGYPSSRRAIARVEIEESLKRRVHVVDSDGIEVRQIKAIVEGMKDELCRFCKAGGSVVQYERLLVQRQEEEVGYHMRARRELESLAQSGAPTKMVEELWEKRNEELRVMGIKPVEMPETRRR